MPASFWSIVQLAVSAIISVVLLALLWRRRDAGTILLDLGPSIPGPAIIRYMNVILIAWLLLTTIIFRTRIPIDLADIAQLIFYAALLAVSVLLSSSRTQIREHGVLISGDFLRWKKIKAFRWQRDDPDVITFEIDTALRFLARRRMPILFERRDEIIAVLAQHVV